MKRYGFLHLFAILAIVAVCTMAMVSCKPNTMSAPDDRRANVTFRFGSAAFEHGNIESYRIQFRSIPLFGNQDTPGRHTNWTDVKEEDPNSGTFVLHDMPIGDWVFYVKVSDARRDFIDVCTGTVKVAGDYVVVINEEDSDLTGYGEQELYIRADYVHDNQGITITYENTLTGAIIDVAQTDMQVVKSGKTYVDYYVGSGKLPCGNYLVTVKIYGENGVLIMSKEDTSVIRSTGTDPLIMRVRAEAGAPGGIVIGGGKELEGFIIGDESCLFGEECMYRFMPLSEYTEENAVWYYWYANGERYPSKDSVFYITFKEPGQYVISCTPVGINGEVMKGGSATYRTRVAEPGLNPDGTGPVPPKPSDSEGEGGESGGNGTEGQGTEEVEP